jgi:ribosomal protein S6
LKTYEGMFIFVESLTDDELENAVKDVREEIEKLAGVVDSAARLGRRPFARPQAKHHKAGHYVVFGFDMDPAKVQALLGRIKLKEQVLRAQVVLPGATVTSEPVAAEA